MSKKYNEAMNKIVLSDDVKTAIMKKFKEDNAKLIKRAKIIKFTKISSAAAACVILFAASFSISGKIEAPKQKNVAMDTDIISSKDNIAKNEKQSPVSIYPDNPDKNEDTKAEIKTNDTGSKEINHQNEKKSSVDAGIKQRKEKPTANSSYKEKSETSDNIKTDGYLKSDKSNNTSNDEQISADPESDTQMQSNTVDESELSVLSDQNKKTAVTNSTNDFISSVSRSGGGSNSFDASSESESEKLLGCSIYNNSDGTVLPGGYVQSGFEAKDTNTNEYLFSNDDDNLKLTVSGNSIFEKQSYQSENINGTDTYTKSENDIYYTALWSDSAKYYKLESNSGIEKNELSDIITYINNGSF